MAKDKKKDKKDKQDSQGVEHDAVAAVRAAVERTLAGSADAAQSTRDRTREIVDDIAQAASRIRHTLEDMRVLDEVKNLRREVEALASRVASLEIPGRGGSVTEPAEPAPAKPAAKPRARKASAAKKAAPARKASTKAAAKPKAASKPKAAAKPRTSTAKKPAAATPAKPAATPTPPAAATPEPKPAAPSPSTES